MPVLCPKLLYSQLSTLKLISIQRYFTLTELCLTLLKGTSVILTCVPYMQNYQPLSIILFLVQDHLVNIKSHGQSHGKYSVKKLYFPQASLCTLSARSLQTWLQYSTLQPFSVTDPCKKIHLFHFEPSFK